MADARSTTVDSPPTTANELRVLIGRLARRLRAQGTVGDLTRSQLSLLGRLEREGPATLSELARAEGVRPQSAAAGVAVLEAGGLVAGTPHPIDGRKTVLSLTEAARKQFDDGRLAREDWLDEAMHAELNVDERARLAECLPLLERIARHR